MPVRQIANASRKQASNKSVMMMAGQLGRLPSGVQTAPCKAHRAGVGRRVPTATQQPIASSSKAQSSSCRSPTQRIQTQPGSGFSAAGALSLASQRCGSRQRIAVAPRAADDDAPALSPNSGAKGPPAPLWRVAAALTYLIPWIDCLGLGKEVYHAFPITYWLYFIPGPFVRIYYCNQFAPLIIFFLLFLAVVKNTKIPHFVRFNTMQSVMIDIITMLFTIIRSYFPSELRWSAVLYVFDNFSWMCCMCPILYCIFYALRGKYADIPLISESVYMQVEASQYM